MIIISVVVLMEIPSFPFFEHLCSFGFIRWYMITSFHYFPHTSLYSSDTRWEMRNTFLNIRYRLGIPRRMPGDSISNHNARWNLLGKASSPAWLPDRAYACSHHNPSKARTSGPHGPGSPCSKSKRYSSLPFFPADCMSCP